MTPNRLPDYRHADGHLSELTPNQRRTLDLVAAGKTNAQIADALGMTLDGAKWNVSEVLSKLGFASREEAADYWRWHRRPLHRAARVVRALIGLPLVVKTAAGALTVGLIAVAAWFWLSGSPPDREGPGGIPPFYLEASVEVVSNATAIGTSPAGSLPTEPPETTRGTLRWWYRDQDEWRWDLELTEPPLQAGTSVGWVEDRDLVFYQGITNTYTRSPLPDLPEGVVMPPAMSFFIGPVPAPAKTVDEFVALMRSTGSSWDHAETVGEERILGRRTVILEIGPTSRSSINGVETASGTSRIWIDPELMFVLRMESGGPDEEQSLSVKVTTLIYDEPVSRANVRFAIPAGATLQEDSDRTSTFSSSSLPPAGSTVTVEPGFLGPGFTPEGYSVRGSGVETGSGPGGVTAIYLVLVNTERPNDYIRIEERKRHDAVLPEALRTGEKLSLNDRDAYRTTDRGITKLIWMDGDLAIVLSANAASPDDLLQLAESMHR